MKINGYGIIDENEVIKFEDEIEFKLPNDYKDFLINYNGGEPEIKYPTFTIYELSEQEIKEMGESTGLNYLFDIDELRKYNKEWKSSLPKNTIIIGAGLFGFIVLSTNIDINGIYLWDKNFCITEYEDEDEDEEYQINFYKISETFIEFLNKLK